MGHIPKGVWVAVRLPAGPGLCVYGPPAYYHYLLKAMKHELKPPSQKKPTENQLVDISPLSDEEQHKLDRRELEFLRTESREQEEKRARLYKIVAILIFCTIGLYLIRDYVGVHEISSALEVRRSYYVSYYINLFPDQEKAKNYRIRGDLYVQWKDNERTIYLEKAHFANGGFVTFESCEVDVKKPKHCVDQENRGWYIELTKQKFIE
ncbi:MAG: hypothetical protein HY226_06210 [Candidatus Vogelbacteria bacterium]|nr:hypothetical protein [Candidatus Vogelbacteria bacterium]